MQLLRPILHYFFLFLSIHLQQSCMRASQEIRLKSSFRYFSSSLLKAPKVTDSWLPLHLSGTSALYYLISITSLRWRCHEGTIVKILDLPPTELYIRGKECVPCRVSWASSLNQEVRVRVQVWNWVSVRLTVCVRVRVSSARSKFALLDLIFSLSFCQLSVVLVWPQMDAFFFSGDFVFFRRF